MKKTAVIAAALCMGLTGCNSGLTLGVDGLLEAPKLTDEQTVIHETLLSSVGKNVSLKYPNFLSMDLTAISCFPSISLRS